ncbi:MAG: BON domain-containing protein [Steroidobacteraceae bacterium]
MNFRLMASTLLIAGSLVGGGALAQDSDVHPKSFVKDSVITTKIKSKLAAEHLSSLAHIRVDTDRAGVVWLSGTAPTKDARDYAVEVARNTEGVADVKSSIEVRKEE